MELSGRNKARLNKWALPAVVVAIILFAFLSPLFVEPEEAERMAEGINK